MTFRAHLSGMTAAGLLSLALAGCGSEHPSASESEFPHGAGGVHSRVGEVVLRDVSIDEPEDGRYEAGDVVRLYVTVLNEAERPDTLLGVKTPVAARSFLLVDPDCDGVLDRVGELPLPPDPVMRTPAPGVPDGPEVFYRVDLVLDEPLRSGASVPVTFTFRNAGSTVVQVPVELADTPLIEDDAACGPADPARRG